MPEENNIQQVTNKSRVEQLLAAWAGGDQIELWAPQSNIERILMNILGAVGVDINPIQSRNEALLLQILENGGGSGGGGGSSDFSTAEVTFTNTSETGIAIINVASSFWDDEYSEGGTNGLTWVYPNDSVTVDVVLYKGCAYANVSDETIISSVTGDIEIDATNLTITGAGTATLVGGLIE